MPEFIPLNSIPLPPEEQLQCARQFFELCQRRRTVREFSNKPVSRELLDLLIHTAGTAPSGANRQPWRFVVVTDPEIKRWIRIEVEKEEHENYEYRMPKEWLDDLAVLGTDWHKEFLEVALALIIVFAINYDREGERIHKNYYVKESVAIAVGFLLAAIHNAGLVFAYAHAESDELLAKNLKPTRKRKALLAHPRRLSERECYGS